MCEGLASAPLPGTRRSPPTPLRGRSLNTLALFPSRPQPGDLRTASWRPRHPLRGVYLGLVMASLGAWLEFAWGFFWAGTSSGSSAGSSGGWRFLRTLLGASRQPRAAEPRLEGSATPCRDRKGMQREGRGDASIRSRGRSRGGSGRWRPARSHARAGSGREGARRSHLPGRCRGWRPPPRPRTARWSPH